jgi:hypothetical protein
MEDIIYLEEDEAMALIYDKNTTTELIDEGRWELYKTATFQHGDEWYRFEYAEPATEMQEGQDWFDTFPVQAYRVIPIEKTVIVYVRP